MSCFASIVNLIRFPYYRIYKFSLNMLKPPKLANKRGVKLKIQN